MVNIMVNVTTQLYPEDLYGNNSANNIVGEVITVNAPTNPDNYFFIIPSAAPFYKTTLKVWNYNTNALLVEGTDYVIGHIFVEPLEKIGKIIAGSIRFLRRDITAVIINYHTLGGVWGFNNTAIARELQLININPLTRSWGDIDPLPYSFPALPHNDTMDDVIGSAELKKSIDAITATLVSFGQGIPNNHINDYNNPHHVTAGLLGLGNLDNFKTATLAQAATGTATDLFTTVAGVKAMINAFAVVMDIATRPDAEAAVRNDVLMTALRVYQQTLVTLITPITTSFQAAATDIQNI